MQPASAYAAMSQEPCPTLSCHAGTGVTCNAAVLGCEDGSEHLHLALARMQASLEDLNKRLLASPENAATMDGLLPLPMARFRYACPLSVRHLRCVCAQQTVVWYVHRCSRLLHCPGMPKAPCTRMTHQWLPSLPCTCEPKQPVLPCTAPAQAQHCGWRCPRLGGGQVEGGQGGGACQW
jgi:hypothetical protein